MLLLSCLIYSASLPAGSVFVPAWARTWLRRSGCQPPSTQGQRCPSAAVSPQRAGLRPHPQTRLSIPARRCQEARKLGGREVGWVLRRRDGSWGGFIHIRRFCFVMGTTRDQRGAGLRCNQPQSLSSAACSKNNFPATMEVSRWAVIPLLPFGLLIPIAFLWVYGFSPGVHLPRREANIVGKNSPSVQFPFWAHNQVLLEEEASNGKLWPAQIRGT